MTWHIAIEVPPVWVRQGKPKRLVQKPGLPALHNLGSGRRGTRVYTTQQERLLKAELLKWRKPTDPTRRYDVLLVRVSRHPLDWSATNGKAEELFRAIGGDNTGSSLKHVRDVMADWLGLADDRDPRVRWFVGQRWGPPKYVGVEVWIDSWQDCGGCGQSTLPARFLRGEL